MYLFSATPAVEFLFGGVGPHMHAYFGSTLKMSLIHASYRCDRVRPWCSEEATVYLTLGQAVSMCETTIAVVS